MGLLRSSSKIIQKSVLAGLIAFVWLAGNGRVLAQGTYILPFAETLYKRGSYAQARDEYERYLFYQAGSTEDSLNTLVRIAKCLLFQEDYGAAIAFSTDLFERYPAASLSSRKLNHVSAMAYMGMGYPRSALLIAQQGNDDPIIKFIESLAYLQLYDWEKSINAAVAVSATADTALASRAGSLVAIARLGKDLPDRRPLVAGLMSAGLPGAGYAYCGRYQTGLSSLLLNAMFFLTGAELQRNGLRISAGSLYVIAMGWYLGNIYGSSNAALRYNEEVNRRHTESVYSELQQWLLDSIKNEP